MASLFLKRLSNSWPTRLQRVTLQEETLRAVLTPAGIKRIVMNALKDTPFFISRASIAIRGFHSRPTLVPTLIQTCEPTSTKLKRKLANSTVKHLELQKTQGWDQVAMICARSPFGCRFLPISDAWEVDRWSWAQSWDQSWLQIDLRTTICETVWPPGGSATSLKAKSLGTITTSYGRSR